MEVPVLWYCGRREKWLAKGPCPCDWAEVERESRRNVPRSTAGQAAGWESWFSLLAGCCLPPVRQSARECVAAVSQCPPVSGPPGARLGGNESGQLQLQGTLRSRPHVWECPNDSGADAHAGPCWAMPSLVAAASI